MDSILAKKIARLKNDKVRTIVAFCGAADLGKSYLSEKVVKNLNSCGIATEYLPLDSFLIERAQRLERGISGYEIEAYNQNSALKALSNFKKSLPVNFAPYNHSAGKCGNSFRTLKPCSVLIFDGVQAMHGIFSPYIDFSIFLYTEDDALKKIRYEADLEKRNYTTDLAKQTSESEFAHYKNQISPYKQQADLVLFLKEKWSYQTQ